MIISKVGEEEERTKKSRDLEVENFLFFRFFCQIEANVFFGGDQPID